MLTGAQEIVGHFEISRPPFVSKLSLSFSALSPTSTAEGETMAAASSMAELADLRHSGLESAGSSRQLISPLYYFVRFDP